MNISKIASELGVKRQIIYRVLYGKKMRLTSEFLAALANTINRYSDIAVTISDLKKGIFLSPKLRSVFQSSPARKSRVLRTRVSHLRCFDKSCDPINAAFFGNEAGVRSSSSQRNGTVML